LPVGSSPPVRGSRCRSGASGRRYCGSWALAWLGNLAGAWPCGNLITVAQLSPTEVFTTLGEAVARDMAYEQPDGAQNW
jgi:hypothetical protein